jgi:hypothetical protein
MGQLTLGIKNLTIKLAIFVVMAALLAWALGGTLWPKAARYDFPAVSFNQQQWFWRLELGGREEGPPRYRMMQHSPDQRKPMVADEQVWHQVAGPMICDAGLVYAGCTDPDSDNTWQVICLGPDAPRRQRSVDNRLQLESLLGQLAAGGAFESAP